jgi:predicted dehydrogenase
MRIWSPEGFASVDFGKRTLTLIQPSEELRRRGLDPGKLDSASRALLKEELFGRHFEVLHRDCNAGVDALTRELKHFIHCVQWGTRPRVSGEDGRSAIDLAARILESIRAHEWEGHPGGPTGPSQLPPPQAVFFRPAAGDLAA